VLGLTDNYFYAMQNAMTVDQFRIRVASFLRRNNIAPATFGRKALGDSSWVFRLLNENLEPKEATRNKVLEAMRVWK
jgi:hypothetical protein